MENNLYYTPTIEEFHIGFECEVLGLIGAKEDQRLFSQPTIISQKELLLINRLEIRVKYLDQSDIESLGWIVKGENHFIKGDWILLKYDDGLIIYLDYYAGKLQHSWMYEDSVKTLFEGTIKNKSELIKLMQQLNIK